MYALFDYEFHPTLKSFDVENALGLYEVGTGGNLFGQAEHPELEGVGEGVFYRTDEELRFVFFYRFSVLENLIVPHFFEHRNQLDRIEIVNALCAGVVAECLMVACEAENVL